jgi:hypothetical protein
LIHRCISCNLVLPIPPNARAGGKLKCIRCGQSIYIRPSRGIKQSRTISPERVVQRDEPSSLHRRKKDILFSDVPLPDPQIPCHACGSYLPASFFLASDPHCPKCKEELSASDFPDELAWPEAAAGESSHAPRPKNARRGKTIVEAIRARPVALWMLEEFNRNGGRLLRSVAIEGIVARFGFDFTYVTENTNLGISKSVLKEFKKLTPDVVWSWQFQCWTQKSPFDRPGSRLA